LLDDLKQAVKRRARRCAGRDWFPGRDLRVATRRFGSPTAGWTVACERLSSRSVVWCVGIGEDISFDLALLAAYGMPIEAFDPTPRSLAWVRAQPLPADYRVHPYGLADRDGEASFRPPADPGHVSHSMDPCAAADGTGVRGEVRRLGTLAAMLGQSRVDLLKMDIEGAEYGVIDDLALQPLLPRQLLVEFHHRFPSIGIGRTRAAVATLRSLGYRLFHVSPNGEEYAFLLDDESLAGSVR
jgi:FkbM family methyltransferase